MTIITQGFLGTLIITQGYGGTEVAEQPFVYLTPGRVKENPVSARRAEILTGDRLP